MSNELDLNRRRFLTRATVVTGAIGAGMGAVPFISSMRPSARARALGAPVQVDLSELAPGDMVKVKWRGQPVMVMRRSEKMLAEMATLPEETLRDPDSIEPQQPSYAQNEDRALRSDIFVALARCTHLGCAPALKPEVTADFAGGFFCNCHGSKFDYAGRVYKGVPAQLNLKVPPYRFIDQQTLLIGDDVGVAV